MYFGSRSKLDGPLRLSDSADNYEPGMYVTEHPEIAEAYSGENGGVYEFNIDVRNPLDVTVSLSDSELERIADTLDRYEIDSSKLRKLIGRDPSELDDHDIWFAVTGKAPDAMSAEEYKKRYQQAMQELGYDAIKHKDYDLPVMHEDGEEKWATNWLVFSPSQVYKANENDKTKRMMITRKGISGRVMEDGINAKVVRPYEFLTQTYKIRLNPPKNQSRRKKPNQKDMRQLRVEKSQSKD